MTTAFLVATWENILGIYGSRQAAETRSAEEPSYVWITEYNLETGEMI